MHVRLISLALLALATTATATAQTLPESLLRCDSQFFSELYAQRAALAHTAPLKTDKQGHAWFVAPKEGEDVVWFTQPLKVQQLTISGYFMRTSDGDELGKFYFWGLVFDQPPQAIVSALPNVKWQQDGNNYIVEPMIKRVGDKAWQHNTGAASGIAPGKNSVEKLAMLETSGDKSQLLCTLQGNVTDEDLLPLRPDLKGNHK
ncbi:Lipoprotein [Kosakonia sp. BK9b]|uniref:hypothetical protein n=1 Tax=Kosakonia sp. TaxID=1916651 RepID=UPI00289AADE2|nr:hypothetical protein [Kosakonia sp.]